MRFFWSRKAIIRMSTIASIMIVVAAARLFTPLRDFDFNSWGILLFGAAGLAVSISEAWIHRGERNREWMLSLLGIISGAGVLWFGTMQGLDAIVSDKDKNSRIDIANARAVAAEKKGQDIAADLANAKTELQKLQPKPFRDRLREAVDKIDRSAFDRFVNGGSDAIILEGVQERLINELKSLAEDSDGQRFISVEEWGTSYVGPDGRTTGVRISIKRALLRDDTTRITR